jgi:hypothetical protein
MISAVCESDCRLVKAIGGTHDPLDRTSSRTAADERGNRGLCQ